MNYKTKLYWTIAFAALLYLAWCLWTGWESILQAFAVFRWWILPVCLALAFLNYIIRSFKWQYYLKILEIHLPFRISFQVFLAGLVMSATPGKIGEVFKSYLVKEINGTPMSRSAPIIVAERFTDFIAFVLMALLGVTLLPNGGLVFSVSIGIIVLFLVLISWKPAAGALIGLLARVPWVNRHLEKVRAAYESTYRLIAPWPLCWATSVSLISWFFEGVSFFLILWGFGHTLPLTSVVFIYAFSTIVGALFMTPGGIGPTEGAMGGMLILLYQIPAGIAASATLIVRICTLWYAVAVGMAVLTICASNFTRDPLAAISLDPESPEPAPSPEQVP